jgi:hypothetical protein
MLVVGEINRVKKMYDKRIKVWGIWYLTPLSTIFLAISWHSFLLVEKPGVPAENH